MLALLAPCQRLADIGTDHALVPLAAVERELAALAWGVDRRPAPLAAAAPQVAAHGRGRVTLLEGDGLTPLDAVAPDALVLAGMGASTMVAVLDAGRSVLAGVAQIVAQPNTEAHALRAWARARGWRLTAETLATHRGLWFPTLRLVPGAPDPVYNLAGFSPDELERLGPWLLRSGGPAVESWLSAQATRLARHGDQAAPTFARALALVRATWVP